MSETVAATKKAPKRKNVLSREAMYQIIRAPLITEKGDAAVREGADRVPRRDRRDQAGDQGGG